MLHLVPSVALALLGMWVWRVRVIRSLQVREVQLPGGQQLDVSIVIPARNEADNLPSLLKSLQALKPPAREIIVVDDHSSDATAAVAASYGARVVTPPPLPAGWNGKPWACQAGAQVATGELLLFTDADTVHAPDSLARVLAEHERSGAALLSVIPTHIVVRLWERLQAVFHLLLLVATGASARMQRGERRFVIGQYLLIDRQTYDDIGGHRSVATRIAEDLALARVVAESKRHVVTLFAPGILGVRMYPTGLRAFMKGWRRSFYEGLDSAGPLAVIEIAAVMGWLIGGPLLVAMGALTGDFLALGLGLVLFALAGTFVRGAQAKLGDFPSWAAWAYPLFTLLFCVVSLLAAVDRLVGARPSWKGRRVLSERKESSP